MTYFLQVVNTPIRQKGRIAPPPLHDYYQSVFEEVTDGASNPK
jgi:hypothetical protein